MERLVESFEQFVSKKNKPVSSVKRNSKLNTRNNKGRINEMARISGLDLRKIKAVDFFKKGEVWNFTFKIWLSGSMNVGLQDMDMDAIRTINVLNIRYEKPIKSLVYSDPILSVDYIFKVGYDNGEYEIHEITTGSKDSVHDVMFELMDDELTQQMIDNPEDYDIEDINNVGRFSDDVARFEVELSKGDILKYYSR
jgi:hypothetical protein